jgi:hypothetical protein
VMDLPRLAPIRKPNNGPSEPIPSAVCQIVPDRILNPIAVNKKEPRLPNRFLIEVRK